VRRVRAFSFPVRRKGKNEKLVDWIKSFFGDLCKRPIWPRSKISNADTGLHSAHGFTPAFAAGVAPKEPMKISDLLSATI
jgi:hypothetical protein